MSARLVGQNQYLVVKNGLLAMLRWLRPKERLEETKIEVGLRAKLYDGVCSQTMADDASERQQLTVALQWTAAETQAPRFDVSALVLSGLDCEFVFAEAFGLYAMRRLLAACEEGEMVEDVVVTELLIEVRTSVRHVSGFAALRCLTSFPFALLEKCEKAEASPRKDEP